MFYNLSDLKEDNVKGSFDQNKSIPVNSLSFKFFSDLECDEIVKYCLTNYALKRGTDKDQNVIDYRTNEVCFIPNVTFFEKCLYESGLVILEKVKSTFNCDISHLSGIQFSRYATNQYLNWHNDDYFAYTKSNDFVARKISVSILLNDPSEFDGGEFEILVPRMVNNSEDIPVEVQSYKMEKGQAFAFPSFNCHRVAPVTRGTRYSLVYWFYGKTWR